jgi:hypothetical protein
VVALCTTARSIIARLLKDEIGAQEINRGIECDFSLIEERSIARRSIQGSKSRCNNALMVWMIT